jgi:glycosyltransferase involved in cell wall biosynthesis
MRVTYIHQHFRLPSASGGTRSHELATHLASLGHSVTIIAGWHSEQAPDQAVEQVHGYTVRWLHVPYRNDMGFAKRVLAFVHFMLLAVWQATTTPADLVFATSTPLTVVVPGILGAWSTNAPWVFEVRDLWPEVPIALGVLRNPIAKFFGRSLARIGYHTATRVVALSPGMRDGVVAAGCDPRKVRLVPNFADMDRFSTSNLDPEPFLTRHPHLRNRPIVLYAGTVGFVNGLDYLVKVASHAKAEMSDVAFCIVGDGGKLQSVTEMAAQLRVLDNNLFLFPPVPKDKIAHVLASASVCLSLVIDVPELWMNSANKFFDALAAGRAVAINHEGWQADLLRSSGAGVVLPAIDTKRAWGILRDLLQSPNAVSETGCRAREVASHLFDKRILAGRFVAALNEARYSHYRDHGARS